MKFFSSHSADAEDAFMRPPFSSKEKLRRVVWNMAWLVFARFTPRPLHGYRCWILKVFGARIGKSNFIYPTAKIWAPWLLETEDVVTIAAGVELYNPGGIKLGHHTIISQDAYLCGATHDYNSVDFTYIARKIETGPYAWVCAKAIVLPGVKIGEGAVLGAGSVASRDIKPWSVYAGNPAKYVKNRTGILEAVPTE